MTELSQAVAAPVIDQADAQRHRAPFIWPLEIVAAGLLVAIVLLLLTGVTSRYVFSLPIVWIDEATSTSFLWLAMLGAALAIDRNEHLRLTLFIGLFPSRLRALVEAFALIGAAVFLASADGHETLFDFANWNAHAIYFTDPDGNIAELIARHTLPSSRRDSFEILGISEIGLVTDDVPGTVAQLGLPAYRQGSPQFQPVGDEEGLLILVQRDRPWYPDNRHTAQPIPFSVTLANGAAFSDSGG